MEYNYPMIKNILDFIKSIFVKIKNIEFILLVNITPRSIEYGVLYGKNSLSPLMAAVEKQWRTNDGLIYDFEQFYIIIKKIINEIEEKTSTKCKQIIVLFSIPGVQIINYHTKIHNDDNLPTFHYDTDQYTIIHNSGKIFLLDGAIPVENINNILYETLDMYESYYILNKTIEKQLTFQINRLGFEKFSYQCPHYLLCGSLSTHFNKDIILIEIGKNFTIITINYKKFSYGYFYWHRGVSLFMNNDKVDVELFNKYLMDLSDIIKNHPKSTVIIGGFKCKNFQWTHHLQKINNNKVFYLNQITNGANNNIFFNLISYYGDVFLSNNEGDHPVDSLGQLLL